MIRYGILFLCLLLANGLLHGQSLRDDSISVEEATFVVLGDSVIISYNILGPPDLSYDVEVALLRGDDRPRGGDSTFVFVPRSLTGNVGRVKGSGQKVMIWNYKQDRADTLGFASDYWFQVSATSVAPGLGVEWWHVVLVGGGAAATAILLSGGTEEVPASGELPDPPGIRPPR